MPKPHSHLTHQEQLRLLKKFNSFVISFVRALPPNHTPQQELYKTFTQNVSIFSHLLLIGLYRISVEKIVFLSTCIAQTVQ